MWRQTLLSVAYLLPLPDVSAAAARTGEVSPNMKIAEYVLPKSARPRRLAIHRDEVIFYTDYQRGYPGSLDPESGKVQEWLSPGGHSSRPYGITVTAESVVWYSESGVEPNRIVRFSPVTKHFETWDIPSGGVVIRNMLVVPDGNIYIARSGVKKIGVVRVEH